jgi:hypothetical protein
MRNSAGTIASTSPTKASKLTLNCEVNDQKRGALRAWPARCSGRRRRGPMMRAKRRVGAMAAGLDSPAARGPSAGTGRTRRRGPGRGPSSGRAQDHHPPKTLQHRMPAAD